MTKPLLANVRLSEAGTLAASYGQTCGKLGMIAAGLQYETDNEVRAEMTATAWRLDGVQKHTLARLEELENWDRLGKIGEEILKHLEALERAVVVTWEHWHLQAGIEYFVCELCDNPFEPWKDKDEKVIGPRRCSDCGARLEWQLGEE